MNHDERMHAAVDSLVRLAIAEDIGSGDVTTSLLVPDEARGRAVVRAKEMLVVAGCLPFQKVFQSLSPEVVCRFLIEEGAHAGAGDIIAELTGPFRALLSGERAALNFLQHLCGIATATRAFVEKITPYGTVLLDTRKTLPGWRLLEKDAVRCGGGANHRMGLYDAILIKENHIAACGGIRNAVEKARRRAQALKIEVEVRNLEELRQALQCGPDIIMLDNMPLDDMRQAVKITAGRVPLEASGNVTIDTIAQIAATGVTYISTGAITHSARAADLSMIIEPL